MSKKHDRPDKLPPPKHSDPPVFFNNAHGPVDVDKTPAPPPPPPPPPPPQPAPSSGGGVSPAPTYSPPPPPAPLLPSFVPLNLSNKSFKEAPSDIIQFDDDSIEIALLTELLFEDIGAVELANISRADLIDGQDVLYAPIKNLPNIRREFNPNTIIATAYGLDYFSRFGINLVSRGMYEPYFDDNGDLVVEIDGVLESEEVQVQILTNGTIDIIEES